MSLSDCSHAGHQRWEHRHWLDWQELRNPLPATSCVACRKIPRCCGVLFTWSAPSATINHNNLDTSNMPALILGIPSAGFKSGILLRARLGSDEDRRRGRRLSRPAARRSSGTRPHPLCSTEREIRTAKAPIHSQARLAAHHVTRTMTGAGSDPAHRSLTAPASLTRGRKQ
jgi:hypothetical protein